MAETKNGRSVFSHHRTVFISFLKAVIFIDKEKETSFFDRGSAEKGVEPQTAS
jgi:hypothetical protein